MENKQNGSAQDGVTATATRLRHIAASLGLKQQAFNRAFALAGLTPGPRQWIQALDRILLLLGASLLIAGLSSFFAYNWAELDKFAKFALIEGAMVGAVLLAWRLGLESLGGKVALFAAAFLVGTLLAVYGQTYQTGADPYGLFVGWALLVVVWAIIGRQPGLWLLLAVLLNLALILYWGQVVNPPMAWVGGLVRIFGPLFWLSYLLTDARLALLVFALNATVLAVWEYMAAKGVVWMQGRWLPRLLAVFALAVIMPAVLVTLLGWDRRATGLSHVLSVLLYMGFSGLALWYYRRFTHDLFVLAAVLLAAIVVLTSTIARTTAGGGFEILLFLSVMVIAQTAGAATWLRHVARTKGQSA